MKLIVDTLGSDKGTAEIVKGVLEAVKESAFIPVFVGREDEIKRLLPSSLEYEIIDTDEWIANTEEPAMAIRRKKNSSMVLGLKELKVGNADGFLSAGSTGALLAGGTLIIGRLVGITRAALTIVSPGVNKPTVVLDVGANMDCTSEMIRQFAIMGSCYAQSLFNLNSPKVGLLNIGSEPGKGNALTKESFNVLEGLDINFIGNVEPRDVLNTEAHVVVCDGFAGNVLLKTMEGTADTLLTQLKDAIMSGLATKLGGTLIKPALIGMKRKLDYREYGAAPLLGIKKPVFKAHGSSDSLAIKNGILEMIRFIDGTVIEDISERIRRNENEGRQNISADKRQI